ncbi:hypothetical protein AAF712_012488 [Marasmius tenuissimus]|uniref:RNA methyltransferase n=1 Tax=Marasmius tenuissimus TaxID=585030 RepID=A0ABR2ZIZ0_9AGAR
MTTQHIPVHGNYHGYYSKRPSVTDPRLAALPKDTFTGKRVLDVGCNEGWVTVEIGSFSFSSTNRARKSVNAMTTTTTFQTLNYFPASFEHTFGPLPVPPSRNRGKTVFPHNISFRAGDWVTELDAVPEDKEGYDVVVAFSISKWIHLNRGDPGLTSFFQRVHDVLKPGGVFILEPQPWESYRKARRILSSADVQRDVEVTIRPENFSDVLGKLGFGPPHAG